MRRWLTAVSIGRAVPIMTHSRKESMVSMTGFVRNLFTMRMDLTCSAFVLSLINKLAVDQLRRVPCKRTGRGSWKGGEERWGRAWYGPPGCKAIGTSSQGDITSDQIHAWLQSLALAWWHRRF